jgi:polysaccharide biosynthesis/export protein
MSRSIRLVTCVASLVTAVIASGVTSQASSPQQNAGNALTEPYVIGAGDVLSITVHGQDPTLYSGDVVVRPDGKIWRYMIDEVQASGLTTTELRDALTTAYSKYFKEPTVLLNPKAFNSWKVFITGSVGKSGEYPLNAQMDILGLITIAGGLQDYADRKNIRLIRRHPDGTVENIPFNYNQVFEGKKGPEIPLLKPGDQVVVR